MAESACTPLAIWVHAQESRVTGSCCRHVERVPGQANRSPRRHRASPTPRPRLRLNYRLQATHVTSNFAISNRGKTCRPVTSINDLGIRDQSHRSTDLDNFSAMSSATAVCTPTMSASWAACQEKGRSPPRSGRRVRRSSRRSCRCCRALSSRDRQVVVGEECPAHRSQQTATCTETQRPVTTPTDPTTPKAGARIHR